MILSKEICLEAVKRFGSPLFLYDKAELTGNLSLLVDALPANANLLYSIKANPNPSIIKLLSQNGVMFETASEGELKHLLNIGIDPACVVFSGQAKSKNGIALAVDKRVKLINIESQRELSDVVSYCESAKKTQSVLLRVNPSIDNDGSVLRMGGVPSPYGIDEEQIGAVLMASRSNYVNIDGLFMYAGSQFFNAESVINNTEHLLKLASDLRRHYGLTIRSLDFGGGFGVPEDDSEPEIDLCSLRDGLLNVFKSFDRPKELSEIFFESGRFIVAKSCVYIVSVLDIKISRNIKYVIVDGGINNLGIKQYQYRTFEPRLCALNDNRDTEEVIIVGPTCTPIDVVRSKGLFEKLSIGDCIAIEDCGAYSAYFSPIYFCGHPTPPEIVYEADTNDYVQIRTRGDSSFPCGYGFTGMPI